MKNIKIKNRNILFGILFFGIICFGQSASAATENYGCSSGNLGSSCVNGVGQAGKCEQYESDYICKAISFDDWGSSPVGAGAVTGAKCGAGFEEKAGICFPTNSGLPDPSGGVIEILGSFLSWLFAIFSIFSVGAFVISGIQYLVSAGDTGVIDTAKRNMKWSVVGIIIGLSGFLILKAVISALSGSAIF